MFASKVIVHHILPAIETAEALCSRQFKFFDQQTAGCSRHIFKRQGKNKMALLQLITTLLMIGCNTLLAQKTERIYLSGTGNDQSVDWQFYCTGGRNSGKWTTIPVPSNWELKGFGTYNYGLDKDTLRGKESGLYRYRFGIAAAWKNRRCILDTNRNLFNLREV